MIDLTKEQAVQIGESEIWKKWTDRQLVGFQLYQPKLCVPFGEFHRATEAVLGRPVYNTEFGFNLDGLQAEFEGKGTPPTFEEIIDMLPLDKSQIILVGGKQ